MMRSGSALAGLALLASSVQAQAPDGTAGTDSSRVTRLETISVTVERPRASPPPVTTIEVPPSELRRTFATDAYDLLRRTSGIEVHQQGQGPGFASDAVIRGFSSDHSSDVLLTIDGVPVNLPVHGHVEGYSDWSLLSPATVGALRVITGPASPLYGDFSLGGVVEVFTAADAAGTSASLGGSSAGDASGWLRSGRRSDSGGVLVAGEGRRQQGWRDHSAYWLGNGAVRGWRRAGSGRLEGGLSLYGSSWDSPGFVSVNDYNADHVTQAMDPTDGGTAYRGIAQGRFTALAGETGVEATAWLQRVRSSVYLTIPDDNDLNQSDEEERRTAVGGRLQVSRPAGAGDVSAGFDGRADIAAYDLHATRARDRVSPTLGYDARYFGGGAFIRWRTLVGTHVALDVGARTDLVYYRTQDRVVGRLAVGDRRHREPEAGRPLPPRRRLVGAGVGEPGVPRSAGRDRGPEAGSDSRLEQGAGGTLRRRVGHGPGGALPAGRLPRADSGPGDPAGPRRPVGASARGSTPTSGCG